MQQLLGAELGGALGDRPLLIIAMVGIIAYSNSFGVPFVLDDTGQISDNPMIKDLANFGRALGGTAFTEADGYLYNSRRFIGYLSFALDYRLWGLDVTGYHAVNLAIHILNSILVYFLVLLTFRTPYFNGQRSAISDQQSGDSRFTIHDSRSVDHSPFTIYDSRSFIALFSALLFVAHPVQTQAVTYVVQRFTSLATMFYILSVVLYIKGRLITEKARGHGPEAVEGKSSTDKGSLALPVAYYFLSLLSAVFAMETKEIAFTLPMIILLYEFLFFGSLQRKKLLLIIPFLLVLLIILLSIIGTGKSLSELLPAISKLTRVQSDIPRTVYFFTELRVIMTYLRLLVLPVRQNLDYDYPLQHSFFSLSVVLSFLFLAALFGIAIYLLYKSRQEATAGSEGGEGSNQPSAVSFQQFGDSSRFTIHDSRVVDYSPLTTHYSLFTIHCFRLIAFGIFWFFITLSIESSFIPITDVIFEHRLYLPSVGAFVAIAAGAGLLAGRSGLFERKRVFAVMAAIIVVLSVVTFMRNRTWRTEVDLLEDTVMKSPEKVRPLNLLALAYLKVARFGDAENLFKKALAADPDHAYEYFNNLGHLYIEANRLDFAEVVLRQAIEISPDFPTAYANLCGVFVASGKFEEALRDCKEAIRLQPAFPVAYNNLSSVYRKLGMREDAIKSAETAIAFNPDYAPPYNNLGLAYVELKRYDEALKQFTKAVRIDPAYVEAYSNLGGLYLVLARYGAAIEEFQKALKINPSYNRAHYNLGLAYVLAGNRDAAMNEHAILQRTAPQDAERLLSFINR